MAVSKNVSADNGISDAGGASILPNLGSDGTGADAVVRKGRSNEQRASFRVWRTSAAEVVHERLRDGWQKWQLQRHVGFLPSCSQHIGAPVNVVETQADDLARAETVGSHEQEHRKVAASGRGVSWDRSKDTSNRGPRKRPRWMLIGTIARRHNI
jgi:hypothetical protein